MKDLTMYSNKNENFLKLISERYNAKASLLLNNLSFSFIKFYKKCKMKYQYKTNI